MEKRVLLFDGNEKQVFSTDDPGQVIFRFKDTMTAFGGVKRAVLKGKGIVNTAISSFIFRHLGENGVKTHFISQISEREQLCRRIEAIPLEMVVCNYVNGPLTERLGLEEGMKPSEVIIYLRYNNDELGDPLINDTEAVVLGLLTRKELADIYKIAEKIDSIVSSLFDKAGLKLIDLKLEFGRTEDGELILCDEITPDTCRIWDAANDEPLDKDRFRHDLGDIVASYEKVADKLNVKLS